MRSNAMVVLGLFLTGVVPVTPMMLMMCGCDEEQRATGQATAVPPAPAESASMRKARHDMLTLGYEDAAGREAEAELTFRFRAEADEGRQRLREQLPKPWRVSAARIEGNFMELTVSRNPLPESSEALRREADAVVKLAGECGGSNEAFTVLILAPAQ